MDFEEGQRKKNIKCDIKRCTVPLFTTEIPHNAMVKTSCDPKWQPEMLEYPTPIYQPCSHHNELLERGGRNSDEIGRMDHTPVNVIKTNRSVLKTVKPQMTKLTKEIIENTFSKMAIDLNYSFPLVNDTSEDCSNFFGERQSNKYSPQVKTPSEMSEKDLISNLEVSCIAKDVAENICVKLESAVMDTCNAASQENQHVEYSGAFKASRNDLVYKQPKEMFNVSRAQPSVTFVSGITKEIIHTVSNKLEDFAISKQTFLHITQMTSIGNSHTEMFTQQLGNTSMSIFKEILDVTSSTEIAPLNQRVTIDQLCVREEIQIHKLRMSPSGSKLFSCIGDILKSILGSILKELDQDNSLNASNQQMFQSQERSVLYGLITSILSDLNALGCEEICETLKSGAAENEIGLQDTPNDQYCAIDFKPQPTLISPQQSIIDHGMENEYPPIYFFDKVMHSEIDLEEASVSSHISSCSKCVTSLSNSSCENKLRDVEVMASKSKVRPIIEAAEYFVNDTLAKITADDEFPYSSYFCSGDWDNALRFAPESHLNAKQPFTASKVRLFVLHIVESVIKLLSLAFDYNIFSHVTAFPTISNAPFMELCADLKIYKEGMVDKVHEVPKIYVSQLMKFVIKHRSEQDKYMFAPYTKSVNSVCSLESGTQPTTLKEIYELIAHMIFSELKQFLKLQYKTNYEQYKVKNMSTIPLQSKLYTFAKEFLNTILNALQNTAEEENKTKDSNVITSTDANDTIRVICNLILGTSSAKRNYVSNADSVGQKSAKQLHKTVKGNLHWCATLASLASSNTEKDETETQHISGNSSGSGNMPENNYLLQINDDIELDNVIPRPRLSRVSKLSEEGAIQCVNKMRPIVKEAKRLVTDTLEKIMADVEFVCFLNNNTYEDNLTFVSESQLKTMYTFPAFSVLLFAIDITESMLKMLSVAFEQEGVFNDTTNGPFMGLCADLWLLKEDIGCLTTFVEVDMSFINMFEKKDNKQDCLEPLTQSVILNMIGQHLIDMISKKFASFIQLHCKSDSGDERAAHIPATDIPLETTSLSKLYPYTREVSANIFYLISNTIDEKQNNCVSSGIKQAEEKVC